MIKSRLCESNVLIFPDDVDTLGQLDALAGKHNWFGSGSRLIITTRDEHLLKTHKVDGICRVRLLSDEEAIRLFNKHSYNEEDPIEDYKTLSLLVVSYAAGLPLALKVLGSFLYDKGKKGWMSTLARLKDIPKKEIVEILKISYDGLEPVEKELFLDIACFWRWRSRDEAMEILEACDVHPEIGIEVLRQKVLVTTVNGMLDMHDLVQEMGHYIIRREHARSPEMHSRVWKDEDIRNMCSGYATMENDKIEAIKYDSYSYEDGHSLDFCNIISNMKKLRCLWVDMDYDNVAAYDKEPYKYDAGPNFLSNELCYIKWYRYPASPFPDCFKLRKLVVLKLSSKQKEVWKGCKHLPNLKVLELKFMEKLVSTPDFDGLPCLQKLTLGYCDELEEIHPSLGKLTSLVFLRVSHCYQLKKFPTISYMKNLHTLEIENCGLEDAEISCNTVELSNIQVLNICTNYFSRLDFRHSQLSQLKVLNLSGLELLELPELPSSLAVLKANSCESLTTVGDCHKNCKWLCEVSIMGGSIINDGWRLLETMLKGKAIEYVSMLLQLKDVEVAKEFTPCLRDGSRCRLQLPMNWHNGFSGFLMCAVFINCWTSTVEISMNEEMSGVDSQEGVVWNKSDNDMYKYTWVGYVPFGLLRHTKWWNQTYKALSFNIEDKESCSCFRVRLVGKKHRRGLLETSMDSSDYKPYFRIEHDSASALTFSLTSYYRDLSNTIHA